MKEYKELTYNDLPDEVDIVGISFRTAGKIYYFAAGGVVCKEGEHAIVETARGAEYGIVAQENHLIPKKDLVLPLRSIIRVSTPEDDERFIQNAKREEEAYGIAVKKIAEHELDMKLVDVEYTFDNSKLLFYFTADDRVDFRDLVKDLASVFRTRIELRQIGIRDEAKMMGGLGICGREFCCHSFLGDFAQVTIKMAKEQNLSLNAAKISGACGKLMCCLRYEHESYQQEIALTPKADSRVTTPDGPGTVISTEPLKGICVVRLDHAAEGEVARYHRDLLNQPGNPDKPMTPAAPSYDRAQRAPKGEQAAPAVSASPENRRGQEARRGQESRRPQPVGTPALADEKRTEQAAQSPDRRGGRGQNAMGNHAPRSEAVDHNKKRDNRPEAKQVENIPAEPTVTFQTGDVQKNVAPKSNDAPKNSGMQKNNDAQKNNAQKTGDAPKNGGDRRDRTPQKQSRSDGRPAEKKSESKFDVRFGGGEMPDSPRSEENKSENRSSGRYRPYHRRGGKNGEKNSEKKTQKTENNN